MLLTCKAGQKQWAVGLPQRKTLPRSAAHSTVSNSNYIYQISHTEYSWCALLIAAINPEANKTFMQLPILGSQKLK
jgi:hypothetical protein